MHRLASSTSPYIKTKKDLVQTSLSPSHHRCSAVFRCPTVLEVPAVLECSVVPRVLSLLPAFLIMRLSAFPNGSPHYHMKSLGD